MVQAKRVQLEPEDLSIYKKKKMYQYLNENGNMRHSICKSKKADTRISTTRNPGSQWVLSNTLKIA